MTLKLDEISHCFGSTQALKDISLNISCGEQVALIGPSGAGKTSLLRIIGAQLMPSQGEVDIVGRRIADLSLSQLRKLRSKIAMIPQDHALVPNVRVLRNVLNGSLGKMSLLACLRQILFLKKEEKIRVYKLLDRVGIGEKMYDRTDSLSGGQQQRVSMARALYQKPEIFLADEPVASTDPRRSHDIIELLCDISTQEGVTLIVSLHDLEIARRFFPRLIGLREGRVHFDMKTKDLSQEDFRKLYKL